MTAVVSHTITEAAAVISKMDTIERAESEVATSIIITEEAYQALQSSLPGKSDEHSFQLLVQYLQQKE